MGNTMPTQKIPYIGVPARVFAKQYSAEQIENEFGPVLERVQAQFAKGTTLPPLALKKVSLLYLLRVMKFIIFAKLMGAGKPSPFFNNRGEPVSKPYILSKQERMELRPLCGMKRQDGI